MKKIFTTKRLCRAGVIAALYVALTYAFGALSYNGFLQIRPAEALCILPIFYVEAIPALFVGCALANITSPFFLYDVVFGSLITLIAAIGTRYVGRLFKKTVLRIVFGGIFPVLLNAFLIPVIIVFLVGGDAGAQGADLVAYFTLVASMTVTQAVWVYGLGTPTYLFIRRQRRLGVPIFCER